MFMLVSGLKVLEVFGCVLCFSVGVFLGEVGSVCLFGLVFFVCLSRMWGVLGWGFFKLTKKYFSTHHIQPMELRIQLIKIVFFAVTEFMKAEALTLLVAIWQVKTGKGI